jgi:hypothetical protein
MATSEKLFKNTDVELQSLANNNREDKKDNEVINFEQAVERAGGFGAFHAFFVCFVIMTITSNGFLFYALPFL